MTPEKPLHVALREARIAAGLTIPEVVEQTGIARSSLYGWEAGTFRPKGDAVIRLANLYGVDAIDFIYLMGDNE